MRILIVVLVCAISTLTGCATIIRGTEQQVHVNTNPVGAKVEFSNGQSCLSPCSIKTKRDQSLVINISKEGCSTQTATMVPTLAGGGVILGGLIDYGTGAVYDLQPNPITITLACTDIASNTNNPRNAPQKSNVVINEVPQDNGINDVAINFNDGKIAFNRGDYQQAIKIWEVLASQGNADAQNNLGVMYAKGIGIPRNDPEALKWFRLAAAQGVEFAKESLKHPEMVQAAKMK